MSSHNALRPSGRLVLLRDLRNRADRELCDLNEQISEELQRMASAPYHDADGEYVLPQSRSDQ